MAIQIQGNGGVIAEVDGTAFRALRVANRPIDYGALGIYSVSMSTGVMAAGLAAGAEIWQLRWTDATRFCAVYSVEFDGAGSIAAFAAGATRADVVVARSWTADGSGGTAATLTGNNNKLRSSMGSTLVGAIRIASTAALTAGTKTLDSQAVGAVASGATATAGIGILPALHLFSASDDSDNHPIVLAQNEGLVVRCTVPATGTWTGGVSSRWAELGAY